MLKKKESYLCLSAMLRAREPKLLNADKASRMLDASSFEEAAKLLTDCGYDDMSQMRTSEIEQALSDHRKEIFDEIERLSPDKIIPELFRMKYDYHNAKVILKAEAMETKSDHLLSDAGRMSPALLKGLYHEEKYSSMPGGLGKAMEEAASVLAMPAEKYCAFLAKLAVQSAPDGEGQIVLNASDRKNYGEAVVKQANDALGGKLTLSSETGDFAGGLIVRNGAVEVNNTLELLIDLCRGDMAAEVAKILFG